MTQHLILRRFVEGGPRRFFQTVDTLRDATLDGTSGCRPRLVLGHQRRLRQEQGQPDDVGQHQLAQSRIALGPNASLPATPGCVPFNFFGGAGSITPAMIDCVTFVQHDSSEQRLWDVTANLSGSCSNCRAASLDSRWRRISRAQRPFRPDPVVAAGFSSDIPARPTSGSYNVKEAYAELNAPAGGYPAANCSNWMRLPVSRIIRSSGSTTTFKGAVNWKPIRGAAPARLLCGGLPRSVDRRAVWTLSRFDQTIRDPCSNDSTAPTMSQQYRRQGQLHCSRRAGQGSYRRRTRRFRAGSAATKT